PRPAVVSDAGAMLGFVVSSDTTAGLRALSRREGATLFMTLLSAWQLLLSRYAGQEEVLVGTPIAGRTRLETEGVIGFFVNTLVLRADLSGEPEFRGLLRQVRETTLGAYAHQEVPFEKLVEELGVERSLAHTPLFQVLFTLQNNEQGELALGETGVESLGTGGASVKFDLMLNLVEVEEVIQGGLAYRRELWEGASMERLLEHYVRVLEAVAAGPERRLSEVSLLGDAERAQVLEAWNRTATAYPRGRCIHELFAEQVARTPDAPAIVFGRESLSFADLDRHSSRLAHALRRRGVGPEVRVVLCLERGPDQFVALLAALKAGGAYVPLDPAYPSGRLAYILEDALAPVVLTRSSLRDRLPASPAEILCVDQLDLDHESDAVPFSGVLPENLAYVIYTSGSTGRPRGVLVQHRSVVNLATALREAVYSHRGADAPPRVSVNGPIGFDTSVKQWVQLLSGATLCPVPEEVRYEGEAFMGFLRESRVDVLDCTPAQLRLLAREGLLERSASLPSDVLVAGEAIEAELWHDLAACTERRFWNLYGPTECTVDAALCCAQGERPAIGRPVGNARAYVLDARGDPVPVGVPGELYVGGVGVARGYLNLPELTAERFVPDPFSEDAGARLYRTGDRVRWRSAGELEYLGRTDFQVKVRGFRIEPGEIEAALVAHPSVREAVAVAREDAPGQKRLVGYVVPEAAVSIAELRAHLRAGLPEYMVPAALVILEALPLTAHGKVDRRALPAPEGSSGEGYLAPRSPTEEILAGIWSEVLGAERVGATEDFFALGGHSLLATRVISRVREAFGTELPLRALFEVPTVAGLAERIEQARREGSGLRVPPVVRVPREGPLPLSFAQQRLWFLDRLEPGRSTYNLPYALRIRGGLDLRALERALTEIVRRHESLRTRFPVLDAQPVQWIEPARTLRLPLVDLGGVPGDARDAELARLVAEEARRPFDLATGPLLRATVARLGEEEVGVLLTLH
ncbi:MAG TPA: amino acid adenylation domain-containing protein, partial [Longimicrobiaceae bacterium]|nr:amino acid adenylation domain-containing protein [Longimicrobiaceae bacterium]